jgi:uncharacterized protein YggL (DUF469 family)
MKLFILSGFETQSYSTHTIFYATSLEEATRLVDAFADWLIDHFDLKYDDSNEGMIVTAFSNELYAACSETSNKSNLTKDKLVRELLLSIEDVEMNTILFDRSKVDGD